MANQKYVIAGGAAGRDRLRLLSEVMDPHTRRNIARAAIPEGARCLDIGCGGGEVSVLLAQAVGASGKVVGIDLDEEQLAIVRQELADRDLTNIELECRDATEWTPSEPFDYVYMRFILTHLADPLALLRAAKSCLRPGGMVLVEDIDFRGHFSEPRCEALDRSVQLYTDSVSKRGADANIGTRLPGLLRNAGFGDIGVDLVHEVAMEFGGMKELVALTALRIAETVVADGSATQGEMDRVVDELYSFARDPETLLAGPRVFQAWGTVAP